MLFLYRGRFVSDPHEARFVEDTPEAFRELLDDPDVVADEEGKEAAMVLCGASYFDDANERDKEGIDAVHWLILDVDNIPRRGDFETAADRVPNETELRTALKGFRAVVYTSPRHTTKNPRWRVLLPLASPLPPKKHRDLVRKLSQQLVPGFPGCIDVDQTGDPGRLGFVGVTMEPDHYKWFVLEGKELDWTEIPLEDEVWTHIPLGGLDRQEQWTDRETAFAQASKYYAAQTYDRSRGHRTIILWQIAMELWWEWAAEDEDFVMDILRQVNLQFWEAKPEDLLFRRMREAHKRTVGDRRKEQLSGGYGHRREPLHTSSIASIKHHAKRLKNRQKPELARLGDEMYRMIEGETVADDPQTWRSALTRIAQELARTFASDRKERIAAFFKPSLATMQHSGNPVPSLEEIEAWIGVYIEGEKKRREEQAQRNVDSLRNNIRISTGGARENKYTQDEIETWKETVGFDETRWLLVNGKTVYVFCNGTWIGPFNEMEFEASGYRALEAGSQFIRFKNYNDEKGTSAYIPLKQLLSRYGSKVEVRVDFSCEKAYYRAEDNTLVLAGPEKNPLQPKFHVEVDQWFRVLTGRAEPPDERTRRAEAAKDRTARVVVKKSTPKAPEPVKETIDIRASDADAAKKLAGRGGLGGRFAGRFAAAAAVAAVAVTTSTPTTSGGLGSRFANVLAAAAEATEKAQAEPQKPKSGLAARFASKVAPSTAAAAEDDDESGIVGDGTGNNYEWVSDLEEDDYDTLCNWCACFLANDQPCSALFLEGEHSVGKGLFSDGLARIWRGGKISIEAALSHFNALLTSTPYVHVDEGLPKGMTASVLLRRDLARSEHEYTRKNRDSGKIDGCIRLLFTANNLDVFNKDGELLKKDDVDAFGQRFVHIRCRPEAAKFLKKMGRHHHDFVKANMIAEHVLWLIKKRFAAIQQRDLRFLVHGRTDKVSDVVATNSESTSDACTYICEALLARRKADWFVVRNGQLFVSAVNLHRQMSFDRNIRHTVREVTRAVSSISHGRSQSVISQTGKATRMWPFRLAALKSWCENAQVFEWEDIREALAFMNKDDPPPSTPPPSTPPTPPAPPTPPSTPPAPTTPTGGAPMAHASASVFDDVELTSSQSLAAEAFASTVKAKKKASSVAYCTCGHEHTDHVETWNGDLDCIVHDCACTGFVLLVEERATGPPATGPPLH